KDCLLEEKTPISQLSISSSENKRIRPNMTIVKPPLPFTPLSNQLLPPSLNINNHPLLFFYHKHHQQPIIIDLYHLHHEFLGHDLIHLYFLILLIPPSPPSLNNNLLDYSPSNSPNSHSNSSSSS
ncbi:13639_t:CDS:1, partial [Dentiscutata erythropus]